MLLLLTSLYQSSSHLKISSLSNLPSRLTKEDILNLGSEDSKSKVSFISAQNYFSSSEKEGVYKIFKFFFSLVFIFF
jgi:hypothetical protein